ncbi:hypothetical protein MNBD_GAMMA22-1799 [hydrothermal vent metagenome]|uniref:DUF1269 domain-containing protein n=1 Tax=hydrothermal vent metagenome TaxID=652676 RepID=A0A3B1A611_9ZZZZ
MNRRMYFILPDTDCTRKVHNELLLAKIPENHMHVIAKDGTNLSDLPEASLLQKSDVVHGTQNGFVVGGITGLVLGAIAVFIPLNGFELSGLTVLATAVAGSFIGAWSSSMIALDVPNSKLKPFEKDINEGHILLMAEVPVVQVDEINSLVKKHHPEVDSHGIEPTIPAFP